MPGAITLLRSMFFIPADSERKLTKGEATGANAQILDLEDAVAPSCTRIAPEMALTYLRCRARRDRQRLLAQAQRSVERSAAGYSGAIPRHLAGPRHQRPFQTPGRFSLKAATASRRSSEPKVTPSR